MGVAVALKLSSMLAHKMRMQAGYFCYVGGLEGRLNKTGWQNCHQRCGAVGPSRVWEPGEVDKRKGIPHPPHATMKPLIFMGRHRIIA